MPPVYSNAVTVVLKSVEVGCEVGVVLPRRHGTTEQACHPDVVRNADEFLVEIEFKGAKIMNQLEDVEGRVVLVSFRAHVDMWFIVLLFGRR